MYVNSGEGISLMPMQRLSSDPGKLLSVNTNLCRLWAGFLSLNFFSRKVAVGIEEEEQGASATDFRDPAVHYDLNKSDPH